MPLRPCPSWLVKASDERIGKPLWDIINLSLTSGTFPGGLKEAVVWPLLKKPSLDLQDPANYHPVSRLPFLGKVVEWVVAVRDQLWAFLEETSVLDPFQSSQVMGWKQLWLP